MPPEDHSYPRTPSIPYNAFHYNVYGTSCYAQISYQRGNLPARSGGAGTVASVRRHPAGGISGR